MFSLPQRRASTRRGTLKVRGTLSEPGTAKVNGNPARMLSGNVFEATIHASTGTNTFAVEATDQSGNITSKNYQVSVSATGATYTYDSNGNLTQKAEGTDTWTYEWNAENRLMRVLQNAIEKARFAYDPIGRRVEKVASGVTSAWTYDSETILRQLATSTTVRYIHGQGIDEPLASDDSSAFTYFHADGLGSIARTTSAAGAVALARRYDVWGYHEIASGNAGYAFTGREHDPETSLEYYRARYYDARIGRFLSEDRLKVSSRRLDEFNGYPYAASNPGTRVDPTGLESGAAFRWLWCVDTGRCGEPVRSKGSCGSGPNEPWVPESINGVDFSGCCTRHDGCWDRCGASKECCDNDFGICLQNACDKAGKSSRDPARPTYCQLMAAQYWMAVSTWGGGAYADAQTKCQK